MCSLRKSFSFAVLAAGLATSGFAQEDLLEKFLQSEQEYDETSESWLQELLAAPWDLNRVEAAELQRLPFLAQTQVNAFLAQREREVYFSDLEQALFALQVHGDTLALCRTIFTASLPPALRSRKTFDFALRSRSGEPATVEPSWQGPKYRWYNRIRMQYGAIHFGALTERDPGEVRWDDHRAWHLEWRLPRGRVLFGNFQTEWGMGLAQWGPYAATMASDVRAAARRIGRGVTPFLSSNESAMYEGIAVSQVWKHWAAFAFVSAINRDVTLDETQSAINFRSSGYHRTASELAQRDNLRERAGGGTLQYRFGRGRAIGALFYLAHFNRAWQAANPAVDFFNFTGTQNELLSLAGSWQWTKQAINFEIAQSRSHGKAAAFVFSTEEGWLHATIALFHADRNFHSLQGRSLAGSDDPPQGESGYSAGLRLQPRKNLYVEIYYQREQKLWRTQALLLPPHASRTGVHLEWRAAADLRLRLRYSFAGNEGLVHTREQTLQTTSGIERFRCELEHRLATRLVFKPRFDLVRARPARPNAAPSTTNVQRPGTAMAMEVSYQFSSRFSLNFRQSHFDSFLPIYQYERDLPGSFTSVALRERGFRRYIYWYLTLHPNLSVTGKISGVQPDFFSTTARSSFTWGLQLDWTLR